MASRDQEACAGCGPRHIVHLALLGALVLEVGSKELVTGRIIAIEPTKTGMLPMTPGSDAPTCTCLARASNPD